MKNTFSFTSFLVLVALLAAGPLSAATIVSLNFNSGTTLASGDSAGVLNAANWNNYDQDPSGVTLSNLNDSDGNATTIDFVFGTDSPNAGDEGWASTQGSDVGTDDGSANWDMFSEGVRLEDSPSTLTITGLGANAVTDVYLYLGHRSASAQGVTNSFSVGSTTYYVSTDGGSNYWPQAGGFNQVTSTNAGSPDTVGTPDPVNYVLFEDIAGDEFTISITNDNSFQSMLSGVQLESTIIPEPSAAALLVGALGMLLITRRQRS